MKNIRVLHGVTDYLTSGLMAASPWLFGFKDDSLATGLMIAAGVISLAYNLATDYDLGAVRKMSLPLHFECDLVLGMALVILPLAMSLSSWIPAAFGIVLVIRALVLAVTLGFVRLPTRASRR